MCSQSFPLSEQYHFFYVVEANKTFDWGHELERLETNLDSFSDVTQQWCVVVPLL